MERLRHGAVVAGVAAMLAFGTVASANGTARNPGRATAPAIVHLGPVGVATAVQLLVAATNLTGTARRVSMQMLDEDGNLVSGTSQTVEPGETESVTVSLPEFTYVRVRVSIPGGSAKGWAIALYLQDAGTGANIGRLGPSRVMTGRELRSAILHMTPSEGLRLAIANLDTTSAKFRAVLFGLFGAKGETASIDSLAPRHIGFTEFPDGSETYARVALHAPAGAKYLVSADVYDTTSARAHITAEDDWETPVA